MKKFKTHEIRGLLNRVIVDEISFSRMVEIMNEMVSKEEDIPEGLKEGDLAIFWMFDKTQAAVRLFDKEQGDISQLPIYVDNTGHWWRNAIKFESKEQFNRFIKGEI